jgi:heme-degrading monooxygenase HmoA
VHVTTEQELNPAQRASLSRLIADALSEVAAISIDAVEVVFSEGIGRAGEQAASAPRETAAPREVVRADYVQIGRLPYDPADEARYLAWRRDVLSPVMSAAEGFVSSVILRPHDGESSYLVLNKWLTRQHRDAYMQSDGHKSMKRETQRVLGRDHPKPVDADVIHLD